MVAGERLRGGRPIAEGPTDNNAGTAIPNLTQAQVDQVSAIAQSVYNYDTGGVLSSLGDKDDRLVAKLDANLSSTQRAVVDLHLRQRRHQPAEQHLLVDHDGQPGPGPGVERLYSGQPAAHRRGAAELAMVGQLLDRSARVLQALPPHPGPVAGPWLRAAARLHQPDQLGRKRDQYVGIDDRLRTQQRDRGRHRRGRVVRSGHLAPDQRAGHRNLGRPAPDAPDHERSRRARIRRICQM